jgi:hypothetical protein
VRLEGLGQLKTPKTLSGIEPACSIVPQPATLLRVPRFYGSVVFITQRSIKLSNEDILLIWRKNINHTSDRMTRKVFGLQNNEVNKIFRPGSNEVHNSVTFFTYLRPEFNSPEDKQRNQH